MHYEIKDGFGTTRDRREADTPREALAKYASSVDAKVEVLSRAGWHAAESK